MAPFHSNRGNRSTVAVEPPDYIITAPVLPQWEPRRGNCAL
ncbi:MAG TPA: hypothetical protein VJX48_08620 [Xanthobacteraceae bacterium]|nr:hypothetical protein [Xanthobacteraceae bacterium]